MASLIAPDGLPHRPGGPPSSPLMASLIAPDVDRPRKACIRHDPRLHRGLANAPILGLLSLRILLALGVQDAVLCILDPIAPGMLDMAPFSLDTAPGMLETAPYARDGASHATVR